MEVVTVSQSRSRARISRAGVFMACWLALGVLSCGLFGLLLGNWVFVCAYLPLFLPGAVIGLGGWAWEGDSRRLSRCGFTVACVCYALTLVALGVGVLAGIARIFSSVG